MAVAMQVATAEIVREQEDDVRLVGGEGNAGCQQQNQRGQMECDSHHGLALS